MLEDIMPNNLLYFLNKLNFSLLTEIRLRANAPIIIYMGTVPYFLTENGVSNLQELAIFCERNWIEDIVFRASNCSLYSVNENIKRGYLVLDNGIRIGICGDAIYENNEVKTINNFSSINIRIPHQIKNCATPIMPHIFENNQIKNTLIISPPGAGKTTLLRDIAYQFSQENIIKNISIIDERNEICAEKLSVGYYADVIKNLPKRIAFEQLIRVMNPDLIITDEIANSDIPFLINTFNCGVKVIASIHAENIEELKAKKYFSEILDNKYFERFIVLSKHNRLGNIEGIYNSRLLRIGIVL